MCFSTFPGCCPVPRPPLASRAEKPGEPGAPGPARGPRPGSLQPSWPPEAAAPPFPRRPESPVCPGRCAAQVDGEPDPLVGGRPCPGGAAGVVLAAGRLGLQGVVEGAEHARRQPPVQLLQQLLGPLAAAPRPRRPLLGRPGGLRAQREQRRAEQRQQRRRRRPHLQGRRRQRGWGQRGHRARPPAPARSPRPAAPYPASLHGARAASPPGSRGERRAAAPRRATGSPGGGAVGKVPRASLHLPWPRLPGTCSAALTAAASARARARAGPASQRCPGDTPRARTGTDGSGPRPRRGNPAEPPGLPSGAPLSLPPHRRHGQEPGCPQPRRDTRHTVALSGPGLETEAEPGGFGPVGAKVSRLMWKNVGIYSWGRDCSSSDSPSHFRAVGTVPRRSLWFLTYPTPGGTFGTFLHPSCAVSPAGTEVLMSSMKAGPDPPFLLPRWPGADTQGRVTLLAAREAPSEEKFALYLPKGGWGESRLQWLLRLFCTFKNT